MSEASQSQSLTADITELSESLKHKDIELDKQQTIMKDFKIDNDVSKIEKIEIFKAHSLSNKI